jgi:hypothetical protein
MFGTPLEPDVLVPESVRLLMINRSPEENRHILHAEEVLERVTSGLSGAGYAFGASRLVLDMHNFTDIQSDLAYNYSVIIMVHGQQAVNFVFAPRCAVLIELSPRGFFTTMYGVIAATSMVIITMDLSRPMSLRSIRAASNHISDLRRHSLSIGVLESRNMFDRKQRPLSKYCLSCCLSEQGALRMDSKVCRSRTSLLCRGNIAEMPVVFRDLYTGKGNRQPIELD